MKDKVKRKYLHTTLGDMFGSMEASKFEELLTEQTGADKAWLATIEKYGGQKFQRCHEVLVRQDSSLSTMNARGEGPLQHVKENTLYKHLGKAFVDTIIVPRQVTTVVKIIPGRVVSPSAASSVANAVALWVFCQWGKFNVGIDFVRHISLTLHAVFPGIEWERVLARKFALFERADAAV